MGELMTNVEDTLRAAYLRAAYADIQDEEEGVYRNRLFYSGEQGIALTARQKEYLGDIANDLDEQALANICQRAVAIPLERLGVETITSDAEGDSTLADMVMQWWDANQLGSWQYDTYEYALRDEKSCLIVGWDGTMPTYTLNEMYDGVNGSIRLHYSGDDNSLLFASKRYKAWDPTKLLPTGKTRLTLYFSDRVERYEDDGNAVDGWRLLTPEEVGMSNQSGVDINGVPLGIPNPQPWVDNTGAPLGIPVVVFWNPGGSEIDDVLMPQKALNKATVDLLSAQDLHGFPFLAAKGYKPIMGTDGKPVALKLAPGELMTMSADGDIIRVPGADLKPMFDTGIMAWINLVSIIKGWPPYLFMNGTPPSGIALQVLESSLVNQVLRKQEGFEDSWREAFTLGARLYQKFTGQTLTGDIDIQWKDPHTKDELAEIQRLTAKFDAGQIPLTQRWRELSYSDEQIKDMQAEQVNNAVEAAQKAVMQALMAQRTGPVGMDTANAGMLGDGTGGVNPGVIQGTVNG
jgi:Phage portal protein, SPP1 Gp6-like